MKVIPNSRIQRKSPISSEKTTRPLSPVLPLKKKRRTVSLKQPSSTPSSSSFLQVRSKEQMSQFSQTNQKKSPKRLPPTSPPNPNICDLSSASPTSTKVPSKRRNPSQHQSSQSKVLDSQFSQSNYPDSPPFSLERTRGRSKTIGLETLPLFK